MPGFIFFKTQTQLLRIVLSHVEVSKLDLLATSISVVTKLIVRFSNQSLACTTELMPPKLQYLTGYLKTGLVSLRTETFIATTRQQQWENFLL